MDGNHPAGWVSSSSKLIFSFPFPRINAFSLLSNSCLGEKVVLSLLNARKMMIHQHSPGMSGFEHNLLALGKKITKSDWCN